MEADEVRERRTVGLQGVHGVAGIGIAQRHSAMDDAVRAVAEELAEEAVDSGPGLLRAGGEAALPGEQHQGLLEHAEMGPLRPVEDAVEREDEEDGRAESVEVTGELGAPRRLVLAGNVECRVERLAAGVAASAIRLGKRRWVDGELEALLRVRLADPRLQTRQRLAGDDVDPPGLKVAA